MPLKQLSLMFALVMIDRWSQALPTTVTPLDKAIEHFSRGGFVALLDTANREDEADPLQAARDTRPEDFARPGHVFALSARDGSLAERVGHTEGAVGLALGVMPTRCDD